jgi:tRNA (cmo5U34)-methyltransferase
MNTLEKMDAFFNARAGSYDDHMLKDLGLETFYEETANQFAGLKDTDRLLDLGCGTGLELERLFTICPGLFVTGIDVSDAMLSVLNAKYPGRNLHLICGSYFDLTLEDGAYDYALSTYSLHHFSKDQKKNLYQKIRRALKPSGIFVLGDYTVKTQEEEELHLSESLRLSGENLPAGSYHFDTPFTMETETNLLKSAGFKDIRIAREWESTTLFVAVK